MARKNGTQTKVNTAEVKEKAVKAVEKTADVAAKVVEKTADAAAKAVEKTADAAEKAAEKTVDAAAKTAKAVKKTVKKAETVKAEAFSEIYIQYAGQEVVQKDVVDRIKEIFVADGHRASTIKSLQIYVKPEENAAYYVINKKITGKINLFM